jgi:hypothetical protein
VRLGALVLVVACSKAAPPRDETHASVKPVAAADARASATVDATAALQQPQTFDDLPAALAAVLPADARVIGFGELHQRTDRAQVKSTLAHFTAEALPAIQDKLSDLILETWIVDKNCGKQAVEATAKVGATMRRPVETKSEIGDLADAARKAGIQPHAMRVTCDDYTRIAPPGKPVDAVAMLELTTKELGRIATEAVLHRDKEPTHRPWVAVYGGALHNDRFPEASVADWSYAKRVDAVTADHFVEVDLVVPELAEGDPMLAKEPWFGVVKTAGQKLQVWRRGERSFVIVLPRSPAGSP